MIISEGEKGEIRREAKKIMDSFSEKLSKVSVPDEESAVRRKEHEREEGDGEECNSNFRKIMFENAPEKNKDFILAEKKKWE